MSTPEIDEPKQGSKSKENRISKYVAWGPGYGLGLGIGIFFIPQFAIILPLFVWAMAGSFDSIAGVIDAYDPWIINSLAALFVSWMGAGLIYVATKDKGGLRALGFKRTSLDNMVTVLPVFIAYFFSIAAVFALLAMFVPAVDLDQEQNVGFEGNSSLELIAAFITLVILAPIYEEMLFRGLAFQGVAKKYGYWPAAVGTSLLFAVAHLQLNVGIDTFVLGMFASWLVWHTKSLWPAIFLHAIKNFIAYLFIFVVG